APRQRQTLVLFPGDLRT
nr:TIMP-1=27 kda tissue inhibitor of metalloproteases [human, monocytic cell line THP-1, Peptide Partial, 17 aa] [Homo sapiens]